MIAGQPIHVGTAHAGATLAVETADTTFRVHDVDQLLTEVPPHHLQALCPVQGPHTRTTQADAPNRK